MLGHGGQSAFGRGISEEEITRVEEALGVTLPRSYKSFLRRFGYADWPDYIYGLRPTRLPGLQVVAETLSERHDVEPKMPHHLVPISPDGFGNHYCLDTARIVDGECPVVFWNHERGADQQYQQTHATFLDWLEELVHEVVSEEESERSAEDEPI